ncbi:MAG: YlmC/YmxH family sporulation protein [Blautia massiliensis (ex Durand et al. 2017)]
MTLRELGEKDVIQIRTGEKLGRIDDVIFDEKNAALQSVVLRGRAHLFGLMGYDEDLVIPWQSIRNIGVDAIMTDVEPENLQRRGRHGQ